MTETATRTSTYTKVDVGKTLESFRSVLRLISLSSGCEAHLVEARADDVLEYAHAGYLSEVDIALRDASGVTIRLARFVVSHDAAGWSTDMPGDNIWPPTPSGSIAIIARNTAAWQALSEDRKVAFWSRLKQAWGPAKEDAASAGMETVGSRRYASNAYGLEQTTFRRKGGP